MCGPVGGCGGGAAVLAKGAAPAKVAGSDGGGDVVQQVAQGGGHAAHTTTQAGAGVQQLGKVYGAWGTAAQFAVVNPGTENHAAGEHEKVILQRTTANDTARANQVFQGALRMFGNLRWDQAGAPSDNPNGDHRVVTPELKAQWKAAYPELPVPNRVVFDKATQKPVGLLFVGGEKAPDLGMGALHQHAAGGAIMQHIWFTPGDLNLAFGDATVKQQAIQAALAR